MKKNIDLWIDHREAVIVELTDKDEQIFRLKADAEKQIRYSGGPRQDGLQTTEAVRGKKLDGQLRERLSTYDVVKIYKGITRPPITEWMLPSKHWHAMKEQCINEK